MYWVDKITNIVENRFAKKISNNEEIIIRDEKTCSGRVHVGSLRGVVIHGIIYEALKEKNIKSKFLFEINDFDPMDDCPPYCKQLEIYMGKPLYTVPSPDGNAKNFAEYFAEEFIEVIDNLGFKAEYYRLSDKYKDGKFNETIRLALENADAIRKIYKDISGSEKSKDWMPLQVICPKCGKISTTIVTDFDGETVGFRCEESLVTWTKGCGANGRISPFNGNGKLPWKVDWAAKFKVMNVDIEGAGKDHATKGGSREVSKQICEKIFNYPNPLDIPYDFFVIGGKKMSSSKGRGVSAKEVSDLLPPEIARLLFLRKEPKKPIDFNPEGDTIPILFDEFDRLSEAYFFTDKSKEDFARICELSNLPQCRSKLKNIFYPRFRDVAFIVQLPHIDFLEKIESIKGSKLTKEEKTEAEKRATYAKKWLEIWAPEQFVFKISEELPEESKNIDQNGLLVLKEILNFFESIQKPNGQDLHAFLHSLKENLNLQPNDIFNPIYKAFLGRDSGPKAGFLLSVLDAEFVKKRLKEATRGS